MKILIDTHTHTIASGHAYSTIEENAKEAARKEIEILGITDHAPAMEGGTTKAHFMNFRTIPKKIHDVEVLMGAELNIIEYTGAVDLPQNFLREMDFAIASLHPPCIPFGTYEENTNAIIEAMKNPYIKIIGHPGDPRYVMDIKAVVDAAVSTGTLLEINNCSLIPNGFRIGSEAYMSEILSLCKKQGMPIVLGSDAHFSSHVGEFDYAIKFLEDNAFPEELVINCYVDKFKEFIKKS